MRPSGYNYNSEMLAALLLLLLPMTSGEYHGSTYGYKTVPGVGTYKVHKQPTTWRDAWRTCSEEDAHLAVIDSPEEAEAIKVLLRAARFIKPQSDPRFSEVSYFISVGFHSLYSDHFWTTVFGEPLENMYNPWARGRPNNFMSSSQCGAVNLRMELVDISCDDNDYPFVCEKIIV